MSHVMPGSDECYKGGKEEKKKSKIQHILIPAQGKDTGSCCSQERLHEEECLI